MGKFQVPIDDHHMGPFSAGAPIRRRAACTHSGRGEVNKCHTPFFLSGCQEACQASRVFVPPPPGASLLDTSHAEAYMVRSKGREGALVSGNNPRRPWPSNSGPGFRGGMMPAGKEGGGSKGERTGNLRVGKLKAARAAGLGNTTGRIRARWYRWPGQPLSEFARTRDGGGKGRESMAPREHPASPSTAERPTVRERASQPDHRDAE